MKKIIPILTLIIGVGIGWGIASYQSRFALQEIQQTWTPEFRDIVEEGWAFGKTMTKGERRELLESVVELGNKMATDGNSRIFWQAQQSFLIKKYLENGNTNGVNSTIQYRLEYFVEQYDQGDFEGDINQEIATKLVEAIKSANQSSEPTLKTPGDSVDV
jgi:hypothetical protein